MQNNFCVLLINLLFFIFCLVDSKILTKHEMLQKSLNCPTSHFPVKVKGGGKKDKCPRRRCYVCSRLGQRRLTRFECEICNIGLCVTPCFGIFHSNIE